MSKSTWVTITITVMIAFDAIACVATSAPTPDGIAMHSLHDSQVIYQSPLYFCHEDSDRQSTLFIRSELGNVPAIIFELEGEEEAPSKRCSKASDNLAKWMEKEGVRFLTWWDTEDGNYDVKISASEGYAILSDKRYLFTLKAKNNPGEVMEALRGIASTYGGDAIFN